MALGLWFRHRNTLPWGYLLAGLVTLVATGDVRHEGSAALAYHGLCLVFVVLALAFASTGRRPRRLPPRPSRHVRRAMAAGVLAVGLLGGVVASQYLRRYETEAGQLLQRLNWLPRGGRRVGFNSTVQLNNVAKIQTRDGDAVALRAFADEAPGYLRARAFETYSDGSWEMTQPERSISPSPVPPARPAMPASGPVFVLGPDEAAGWRVADVWPSPHVGVVMFSFLHTRLVRAEATSLSVDAHEVVNSPDISGGENYGVAAPRTPPTETLPEARRRACLALPDDLDPRITALAREIGGDADTPAEKMRRVVRYFHDNYEYHLGLSCPTGQDPLTYFLLERPAAHCEFFAAGAAILLRSLGVPTRYVTGFVAEERMRMDRCWVARNRDAHAWVEAWDETARRWIPLEPTPAAGVPQPRQATLLAGLWDWLAFRWQELGVAVQQGGFWGVVKWLSRRCVGPDQHRVGSDGRRLAGRPVAEKTPPGWWQGLRGRHRSGPADATLLAMRRLLTHMDRRLEKRGLRREPGETLHQFARRLVEADASLELAAGWYRRYADIRYGGTVSAGTLAELGEADDA